MDIDESGAETSIGSPGIFLARRKAKSRDNERHKSVLDNTCPPWHAYLITTYYLSLLLVLFWLALDIWSGQFRLLHQIGFGESVQALRNSTKPDEQSALATFVVVGYTVIGGAMGSILYSIRCFFDHYARRRGKHYSRRWLGKYITAPWEGAAMAMVVASLLRGGVALFGKLQAPADENANAFAVFAIGTLVGFSMREVVGWLHGITITMFGTEKENEAEDAALDEQEAPNTVVRADG